MLQNTINYINSLSCKPTENIEVEIKVLLDHRIKMPRFIDPYLQDKDDINFIVNMLNRALTIGIASMEQTINFIHTYDKNAVSQMFVKQLHYINGVQEPSKKKYYTKKSLIHPMYLISDNLPPYKLSVNLETNQENDINEFDIVRFRLRYSVVFADELKNWKLDLTVVKECRDHSINNLKKIRDRIFDKQINLSNFTKYVDWTYSDKIECELEYIGTDKFDISQIQKIDILFANNQIRQIDTLFTKTYQECICQIAKIIKPNLVDKFRQGIFGIKQIGSNPIEITKRFYQTDILPNIENFFITEKIDGIRSMLLMYPKHGKCFIINNINNHGISVMDIPVSTDAELIILDTEGIQSENTQNSIPCELKYHVFDIIYLHKESSLNIHNLPFIDRLPYMNQIIDRYEFLYHKHYVELSANEYHTQIRSFYKDMLDKSYKIDGIIIFSKDHCYNTTLQYKWKPLMTIDFVLKKCPVSMLGINPYYVKKNQTLYFLFCGIKKSIYKKLGVYKFNQYDKLFTNVRVDGCRYGEVLDAYFPIQFAPSSNPNAYLFWSEQENLDGKIAELTYSDVGEWEFIKIREDRVNDMKRKTYYGNYFKYAEHIWMNFADPLTMDALCQTNKSITYFQEDGHAYRSMRKFNNYVKKILIDINSKHMDLGWVLDLGSGRGQDLYKYIECGFKNILMIDNDYDALMEIINRKYTYVEMKPNRKNNFSDELINNNCKIFIYHANLTDPYKKTLLIKNIFNIDRASLIVCNLALHYIIPNKGKIQNFCRLINSLLAPGGKFIFTAFNGQKIFDLLGDAKVWNSDDSDKPIYSIKKKYKDTTFTGVKQQIEVLLPFSRGEYYSENLININLLNEELEKKKINLVADGSFGSYLSKFAEDKSSIYNKLNDADKHYISLYHFYVYHKNTKK
jgi:hypothetical protein